MGNFKVMRPRTNQNVVTRNCTTGVRIDRWKLKVLEAGSVVVYWVSKPT